MSGSGQLGQALKLTFADGFFGPFKVVGRASMIAWFFQYAMLALNFDPIIMVLSRYARSDLSKPWQH